MNDHRRSLGGLTVSSVVDAGVAEISLQGELDLATAPELEQGLLTVERQRPQRIVIDLRELQFIDSTGLRLLLQADARANELGCELVLRPGEPTVQHVFDVTGAQEVLRFEPAEEGSLGSDPEGSSSTEGPSAT